MKKCRVCGITKELSEFHKEKRSKDGYRNNCKKCRAKSDAFARRNRTVEKRGSEVYTAINDRLTNPKRLETRSRYRKISNNMTREEFISWYVKNYFLSCTVDRIDNDKDYELSNIQMLSKKEHNFKKRLDRLGEFTYKEDVPCSKCGVIKHYSEYFNSVNGVNKYNPYGIKAECKKCSRKTKIKEQNALQI